MKKIILLTLLIFSGLAYSQKDTLDYTKDEMNALFAKVDSLLHQEALLDSLQALRGEIAAKQDAIANIADTSKYLKKIDSTLYATQTDIAGIESDTTGFWAIVNGLVEAALAESDTLIGSAATLDSLITDYWAGTLGADTTGYWSMIYAVVIANPFDTTNVYVVTDSLASDITTKLATSTYTAFKETFSGGTAEQVLAKSSATNYDWVWGTVGEVDISDNTPPSPPTSLVATADNDTAKIRLTWTDPTASDLDSIRIYRAVVADTTAYTYLARVDEGIQSYTNTGLSNGTAYWYKLKAVDDSSNVSGYSNRDSALTYTPPADTGFLMLNAETGSSGWTSYNNGTYFTISTQQAYDGTKSYKISGNGTLTPVYAQKSFSAVNGVYITYRIYIPSTVDSMEDDGWNWLSYVMDSEENQTHGYFMFQSSSGNPSSWMWPESTTESSNYSENAWHKIEVYSQKGTGTNGIDSLWIDEDYQGTITNSTRTLDVSEFRLGALLNYQFIATEAIYVDRIILSTTRLPLD